MREVRKGTDQEKIQSGENTAQQCVGRRLEHVVCASVELLWAPTGTALRTSEGAQPLSPH